MTGADDMANEPSPATIAALGKISTNTLAGLMIKFGGLRSRSITVARPLNPSNAHFAGPAFTIRNAPIREDLASRASIANAGNPFHGTYDRVPAGAVVVIDMLGCTDCGGMGDVIAAALLARGVVGVVTDGAMRDASVIGASALPVFCAGAAPAPVGRALITVGVEEPIGCGGVLVEPGDIVVGDPDGVVVVPRHLAARLVEEAIPLEQAEAEVKQRVEAGAPLSSVYPPAPERVEEIRRELAQNGPAQPGKGGPDGIR